MKILFEDLNRPQDLFQINGHLLASGETVEVDDGYGHYLLGMYPDRLKAVGETPAADVVAAIVPVVPNVETGTPVDAEAERAAE